MEYTQTSLTAQLNPCDYNHNDLPYIPIKAHDRKPSLLACHNLHYIKKIRKNLEAGDLIVDSIIKSGIRSRASFYMWVERYHCKRLKRYLLAAQDRGYSYLDESVEGAFYKKLKEGKGTGSEYEFFLTNRKPERWKKQNESINVLQNATHINMSPIKIVFESTKGIDYAEGRISADIAP